jgi:hypothetical protein
MTPKRALARARAVWQFVKAAGFEAEVTQTGATVFGLGADSKFKGIIGAATTATAGGGGGGGGGSGGEENVVGDDSSGDGAGGSAVATAATVPSSAAVHDLVGNATAIRDDD